jgi:hypothetical protein
MNDHLLEQIVRMPLDGHRPPDAVVPCGGCRRCCQGNSIVMLLEREGDDLASYEHELVTLPGAGRGPILKRRPNGDCFYLGAGGCTIHDRAPAVCRVFDCRRAYLAFMDFPRADRRRMVKAQAVDREILDRGRELLGAAEEVA